MSSRAGHVTTETVYGQTLALQLGNGDEHRALESDTAGLYVKGNLNLYLTEAHSYQEPDQRYRDRLNQGTRHAFLVASSSS